MHFQSSTDKAPSLRTLHGFLLVCCAQSILYSLNFQQALTKSCTYDLVSKPVSTRRRDREGCEFYQRRAHRNSEAHVGMRGELGLRIVR